MISGEYTEYSALTLTKGIKKRDHKSINIDLALSTKLQNTL